MLTGSCLCGSVAYEVDAPIGPIAHCHALLVKGPWLCLSSVSSVPEGQVSLEEGSELAAMNLHPQSTAFFARKWGSQNRFAERAGQPTVI